MSASLRCLLLLGFALPITPALRAQDEQPLPLKRVVLFSSSVGFFEHEGSVKDDKQIEFVFKTEDINDLLKSMVVQDRDGGLISAINYGSPDPLTRTLRTFTIDLTNSPTLAEIFQQLRGQGVKLETPAPVSGIVVGVEVRQIPQGDGKFAPAEVLNVRTPEGLRSIRLETISRTQFVSPKVDKEFQQALDLLANAHTSDQKKVKLDFRGKGERRVSMGYIQEAPVWKTSYRLVLSDDEAPFLQGWAIVENTTTQDWKDVNLTLVSGRPISFVMDLAQPLFMNRPLVVPESHASLSPKVYDQDLAAKEQEFRAAGDQAVAGAGGFGGGGFGGGMGGLAPRERTRSEFRPFVTSVIPVVDGGGGVPRRVRMNLEQGVESAAIGEDAGELFRYGIKAPVTLPRNESAMLPIVSAKVKGEKLAIYNPNVNAKHPLSGLKLTNSTDLHLLQGPITLFDGGEYAGDARIEDIAPGSARLISYALDLETEIVEKSAGETDDPFSDKGVIVSLSIRKGGLHAKRKLTRKVDYVVKNSSGKAKQVLIERPQDEGWKAVSPKPEETTRGVHRYSVKADSGKPVTLTVVEERETTEEFALTTLEPAAIDVYLKVSAATPALKKAFDSFLAAKSKVAAITDQRVQNEVQEAKLADEQGRLRNNLQAIPLKNNELANEENKKTANDLLQRYLKKLGTIENDLEELRTERTKIMEQEAKAKAELEKLLAELVVE
jgi:hypothetical protein